MLDERPHIQSQGRTDNVGILQLCGMKAQGDDGCSVCYDHLQFHIRLVAKLIFLTEECRI